MKKLPRPPRCKYKRCRREADVLIDGDVPLCAHHWNNWFVPLIRSHGKVAKARRYQLTLSDWFTTKPRQKVPPPTTKGLTIRK